MFEAVQSQGVGGGGGWSKSKISYLRFCEVRVNSPVVCPMAADLKTMYFQGKMQEFVGKWLKTDSLSIFKSEFESLFEIISNECVYNAYSGLSLRAGGWGFSPATKRMAPGYFYWKRKQK